MKRATYSPTSHVANNGEPYSIREADVTDAALLLQYARDYFAETDTYTPISPGEFSLNVEQEEEFITGHQKEIAGCLNVTGGRTARTCHVGTLGVSVARQHRGQGMGSTLMEAAIEWMREHPTMRRLELEVFSTNDARLLYQRLGFEEEGRRRNAYIWHGRTLDAVVMAMLFEK